jgi:hypothetical protein
MCHRIDNRRQRTLYLGQSLDLNRNMYMVGTSLRVSNYGRSHSANDYSQRFRVVLFLENLCEFRTKDDTTDYILYSG